MTQLPFELASFFLSDRPLTAARHADWQNKMRYLLVTLAGLFEVCPPKKGDILRNSCFFRVK